ncbi:hypothetical protein [Mycolicibacter kumamotonensis]|uniref:hypothetical protein n=1 Tax=Mycolicibacter kumamotonensis TaxID=354243 RepID=UPI001056375F|nr:hypothetical protein [Mycolicibacter kumamotonensis]
MEPTEAAYLAGLLDGEGTYMITKYTTSRGTTSWSATISMASTDEVLVQKCKSLVGGSITGPVIPKAQNARPSWIWALKGRAIGPVIEELWPYIVLKQRQAALLYMLRSKIEPGARPGQKGRRALTESQIHERESMRLACKALNRRGTDGITEAEFIAYESVKLMDLLMPVSRQIELAQKALVPVP